MTAAACLGCGSEVAAALLACPGCGRLRHQQALEGLAAEAGRAREAGDPAAEAAAWRAALELLPPASRQASQLAARVEELSRDIAAGGATLPEPQPKAGLGKAGVAGAVATVALLLWKLKAVVLLLLGKGKLLLLGLSKAGTVSTMLLSLGVYWAAFGWKLAAGLVASIYVHEMGHVAALRRFGVPATAPMFIPGLGAMIRLKARPATPQEDARVGLAGPRWGLVAALVAAVLHAATGAGAWAAIARVGALINLFNLMPLGPLDGGRAFHALSRWQRWLAVAAIGAAWAATSEGLLLLVGAVAAVRAFSPAAPPVGDRPSLVEYALLTGALAALTLLPVPLGG
jgi:Zn-dependent protease